MNIIYLIVLVNIFRPWANKQDVIEFVQPGVRVKKVLEIDSVLRVGLSKDLKDLRELSKIGGYYCAVFNRVGG
ncbi:MAG: hypothetical protein COS71_03015, partial [Candidatus Moranbacteria bacterium CG06_land_8_20_14_3_00_40_12]